MDDTSAYIGGSYIEGFGDDFIQAVVTVLLVFTPAILCLVYWWYNHREVRRQTIHIDSQGDVDDVRQQMGLWTADGQQANGDAGVVRRHGDRDYTCPVCMDDARFSVQTNCGHIFCAQCMLTYWEIRNRLAAVRCPTCRQQVTLLLSCFSDTEVAEQSTDKQRLVDFIHLYNRRFSGQPLTWTEYLIDLPTLLRHCISEVFSLSGLIWMFRLRVLLCCLFAVLYLISPLDILPEAIFGLFGLLDDVFVVLLITIYISVIYRRLVAARAEAAAAADDNQ